MIPAIKESIRRGNLMLFLGAGASANSTDRKGKKLPDGDGLASLLATRCGSSYQNEPLPIVYAAAKQQLGDLLWPVLEEIFRHCNPSPEYLQLARHCWPRIYTLNIDDSLERALTKSPQKINARYRFDRVSDRHPFFEELDYIKLNGSINRQTDGLVFSPQEYAATSATTPLWYAEAAEDFSRYLVLFIGTRLNESVFLHQLERYKAATGGEFGTSYVLTTSATGIQKHALREFGLEHITGTLKEFTDWLKAEFPKPLSPWDVAVAVYPQLRVMPKKLNQPEYAELFEQIVPVDHAFLSKLGSQYSPGKVRDFYRGFKPTWKDIIDGVPAELNTQQELVARLESPQPNDKLFVVFGPAGSGKTTALMQAALLLKNRTDLPVYYLSQPIDNLKAMIEALEESVESRYFVFIDRLTYLSGQLRDILEADRTKKLIIVAGERQNRWRSHTKAELREWLTKDFALNVIAKDEARAILEKLEQFGPWVRLGQLTEAQRLEELTKKAKQQLLIGLLETTSGIGFEKIIESDYKALGNDNQRRFLITIGLATVHRLAMPEEIASRAIKALGISESIAVLADQMSGIIYRDRAALFARHPVYMEKLFETVVPQHEIAECIKAVLSAFTVYPMPVLRSVKRGVGLIFKLLINHGFLRDKLRRDHTRILDIYESFERYFQQDGLFWLQFGLALRDFNRQEEALARLKAAVTVYPISQTEHAYAQQLMIMAARTSSRQEARRLAEEAQQLLQRIDLLPRDLVSGYPLVTLSEHSVEVARVHDGAKAARQVAKEYANLLNRRLKDYPDNPRVKRAWERLSKYSLTGDWQFPETDALGAP